MVTELRLEDGFKDIEYEGNGQMGGSGAGYWVLGTGCWVLGARCWVLGIGYWVRKYGERGRARETQSALRSLVRVRRSGRITTDKMKSGFYFSSIRNLITLVNYFILNLY